MRLLFRLGQPPGWQTSRRGMLCLPRLLISFTSSTERPGVAVLSRLTILRVLVPLAVVAAVTAAVGIGVLKADFVNWDDQVYVVENPHLRIGSAGDLVWLFTNSYFRSYIPLALLSHAIDFSLWGLQAGGHHLTSLVLHAVNTALFFLLTIVVLAAARERIDPGGKGIFGLVRRNLDATVILGGVFAALLFGIHPTRVEAFAWISDRKDLLSFLFLIPALLSYVQYSALRGSDRARVWYLLSVTLYLLALLSKSSVLVMPGVLVLLDLTVGPRSGWKLHVRRLFTEKLPFLLLSIIAGLAAISSVPSSDISYMLADLTPVQKTLLPLYAVSFYLEKMLWPAPLAAVYDIPPAATMIAMTVIVVLVTGLCILLYTLGQRFWLAAWVYYLLMLFPTIAYPSSGIQPIADRYAYVALPGFFLLAGGALGRLSGESRGIAGRLRIPVIATAAALVIILALLTIRQVAVWENSETLWQHEVDSYSDIAIGYNNLGAAVCKSGRPDEAIMQFTVALGLKPDYAHAWNNLGVAENAKGDIQKAIASYARAIQLEPDYAEAYVNMGEIYLRAGDPDRALNYLEPGLSFDPASARAHCDLGWARFEKGDRDSALPLFRRAVALQSDYARAYYYIGVIQGDRGEAASSLASFRMAAKCGDEESQRLLKARGLTW